VVSVTDPYSRILGFLDLFTGGDTDHYTTEDVTSSGKNLHLPLFEPIAVVEGTNCFRPLQHCDRGFESH
jgi:hypothetical protein